MLRLITAILFFSFCINISTAQSQVLQGGPVENSNSAGKPKKKSKLLQILGNVVTEVITQAINPNTPATSTTNSNNPATSTINPQSGNWTTPTDISTPTGDISRPVQMSKPIDSMSTPVKDGFTPVKDGFTPVKDGFTPVKDGFTPVKDGFTPVKDGFTPVKDGFTPVKDGFTPVKDGFTPVKDGFTPVKDGFTPVKDGFTPVKDGFTPVKNGFTPVKDPFSPNSNEPLNKGSSVEVKNILFKYSKIVNEFFGYMSYTNTEILHEHIYFSDGTNIGWEKKGLFTYDSKPVDFSLRQGGYDEVIMKYAVIQIISEDKLFNRRYSLIGDQYVDKEIVGVDMTDNRIYMDKYNCQDFVQNVLYKYDEIKMLSRINPKLDENDVNRRFKEILNIISHEDPL